jgi:hypothetical protein
MAQRILGPLAWLAFATTELDAVSIMSIGLGSRAALLSTLIPLCLGLALASLIRPPQGAPVLRMMLSGASSLALITLLVLTHLASSQPRPFPIASPVSGSWYALQAGPSPLINHHWYALAQQDAVDIVQLKGSVSHRSNGASLTDYFAFEQPVRSPRTCTVAAVTSDRPDQPIGSTDSHHPAGNLVVLQLAPRRFLLLAHLKAGSVHLHSGERVIAGDLVGLVGNSGNTSEPHLHMQAMDHPTLESSKHSHPLGLINVELNR